MSFDAGLSLHAQCFNWTTPCISDLWQQDCVGGRGLGCLLLSQAEQTAKGSRREVFLKWEKQDTEELSHSYWQLPFESDMEGIRAPPGLSGKESTCKAAATGNRNFIPGSGRSPGGRHGNPLQYSCLENPMDRGAWWATVHGVTKSQTRRKQLSIHREPRLLLLLSC